MAVVQGRLTVTTAGTQRALSDLSDLTAHRRVRWLNVIALSSNTGKVAVGGSGVLAAAGSRNAGWLNPGEVFRLEGADMSDWFIDVEVSGEGVSVVGEA